MLLVQEPPSMAQRDFGDDVVEDDAFNGSVSDPEMPSEVIEAVRHHC